MGQGLKQGGQVLPSNSVHSKLGNPYKSNRKNNDQRERITSIKPLLQFETGGVHFPSGLNFASGHLFYATVCFSITNNEVNRKKNAQFAKASPMYRSCYVTCLGNSAFQSASLLDRSDH